LFPAINCLKTNNLIQLLHIESATSKCSVSISCDGKLVKELVDTGSYSHAAALMPLIDRLFDELNFSKTNLDGVSVSSGPGSYTGLRIGTSTAKGICYALGIPLIAVGSLHAAASGMLALADVSGSDILLPMIDARRMEVFGAVYDAGLNEIEPSHAWIIDGYSLSVFSGRILFLAGSGAEKLKPLYEGNPQVVFLNEQVHLSSNACKLAYDRFVAGQYANTALFEPDYGKEYIPGKPSVKGLK